MTARQIARVFEEVAPLDSGVPNDELGFLWGDVDREVHGVGCLWCVHTASIEEAARLGLDLLICHEALWLPHQRSPWYHCPPEDQLHAARVRGALLDRHGMTVYRSHSNWDAAREVGVADSAVRSLALEGLREVARAKFFGVHELPEPWMVGRLADHVGRALGYTGCRVFGDQDRQVRRFAFLIGGFGENQSHMPQVARHMGAEALIIGEMSEFIVVACLEMGMPVIETLHSVSEIPGIRSQAAILAQRLPRVPVRYVPSGIGGR